MYTYTYIYIHTQINNRYLECKILWFHLALVK